MDNKSVLTDESEFAFAHDIQLSFTEFRILKEAVCKIFNSIIGREQNPLKRTILLGRIVQEAGLIVANETIKYNLKVSVEKHMGD